jgi:hypothetical protein
MLAARPFPLELHEHAIARELDPIKISSGQCRHTMFDGRLRVNFELRSLVPSVNLKECLRHSMGVAATAAPLLVGLSGLVLGTLGLIGIAPMTMVLVALLSTGAAILLHSSFVGGLLLNFLAHVINLGNRKAAGGVQSLAALSCKKLSA